MVMPAEPQEVNEPIETTEAPITENTESEVFIEEADSESNAPIEDISTEGTENVLSDTSEPAVQLPSQPAPSAPQPTAPQISQKDIDELQQRRSSDDEKQWRDMVSRKAQNFERQMQDQGYHPEQAREQSRRFLQQEYKYRKLQQDSSEAVNFTLGKQAAAIHFMKQHGLANKQMLDDFLSLQSAATPDEMEKEVKRMKRERELIAENARLKQGRVSPQTFDNSQGAAEVTTNDDRWLKAYINGDRSQAANEAARRRTIGY